SQIKPIIDTNCAISGCHVSGGIRTDLSQLSVIQSSASSIKTRTGNKSMPIGRTLTQAQIDQIACWVDDGALNN
ncbi:MAG: 2-polyprenyl-6-methoxyphenol hydroxylase, partial [Cyclobacteriaceae bacterium]|nr:2-polyprenyl-6-methoxyphenol hydroxylase [Cyclobacteriaceae bacterium]